MAKAAGLLWKFKGSTGPFTALATVKLPCEVKEVREKLKVNFGLSESTAIDFVVYLESDPEAVASDFQVIRPNARILARRCAAEEAATLIDAANERYRASNDYTEPDEPEPVDDFDNLYEPAPEHVEAAAAPEEQDDEDTKIAELIKAQNFYDDGGAESLSRRYYRNRMLLVNQPQPTAAAEPAGPKPTTDIDDPNFEIIHVDPDYICHMCGQRGHHIKNCTNYDGKRLSKKIRPSTGIPTDFLTPIPDEDLEKYDEVYILKDGKFAIMREAELVSGGAFFTKTVDQRIRTQLGISEKDAQALSRGFKCSLCLCYFNNPVTTLCCGETFCLDCIIGKKTTSITSNLACPTCGRSIRMTDLHANTSLRKTVQALILGNVDVLKKKQEPEEAPEPEKKQEPRCGVNVETLKRWARHRRRQREAVENYLAKYRAYQNSM